MFPQIPTLIDPLTGNQVAAQEPRFSALAEYYGDVKMYTKIDADARDLAKRTDDAWLCGYVRAQELKMPTDPPSYRARAFPPATHVITLTPDYRVRVDNGPAVYVCPPVPAPGTMTLSTSGTGEVLVPITQGPRAGSDGKIAAQTPQQILSALQALFAQAQKMGLI